MNTVKPTNFPKFQKGDYVRVIEPNKPGTVKSYDWANLWIGHVFQLKEDNPYYWNTTSIDPHLKYQLGFYKEQLIPFEWQVGDIACVINQGFGGVPSAIGKNFRVVEIGHNIYGDYIIKLKCLEKLDNVFEVESHIYVQKKHIIPVVFGHSIPLNPTVVQQPTVPKMRYINGD